MRFSLTTLVSIGALLPSAVLGDCVKPVADPDKLGCKFTLSSSTPFSLPVGQLDNGQVRLNTSLPRNDFYISNGTIFNSFGFGCVVKAGAAFHCGYDLQPTAGFSVGPSNTLLFRGTASAFWACPVTTSVYNVYVNPVTTPVRPKYHGKQCFKVTLRASGCSTPPSPGHGNPAFPGHGGPSTTWETETQTITSDVVETVTVTATAEPFCTADNSTLTRRSSEPHSLSKRALFDEWDFVRREAERPGHSDLIGWVPQEQTQWFNLRAGMRVATAYYYGCTVFVAIGTRGLLFGHYLQGCGSTPGDTLESRENTDANIVKKIEQSDPMQEYGPGFDELSPEDCPNSRWAIILGSTSDSGWGKGPARLKEYFMDPLRQNRGPDRDWGIPPRNLHFVLYGKSAGDPGTTPSGKSLIAVDDVGGGIWEVRVYLGSETPRLTLRFPQNTGVVEGNPNVVQVGMSAVTTDGMKNYPEAPPQWQAANFS
ncbi:hypothetical protein OQA88_10546 [Cercophora sp. LCS_1]